MKLKREQIGGPYGDQTCQYNVAWDEKHPTVREFINATLELYPNEYGEFIPVKPFQNPLSVSTYSYDKGALLKGIPEAILDQQVWYVQTSGSWRAMDYYIFLEEDK